jgi:hypothetical protein
MVNERRGEGKGIEALRRGEGKGIVDLREVIVH